MSLKTAGDVDIIEQEEEQVDTPDMYRVIMHNDNYTTMEFVVSVLIKIFKKSTENAITLMMKVHQDEQATVGAYTYDIASTRIVQVHKLAESFDFPLRCSIMGDSE